jgi:hypothetical protein
VNLRSELLQRLQEVRNNCKTRNQLYRNKTFSTRISQELLYLGQVSPNEVGPQEVGAEESGPTEVGLPEKGPVPLKKSYDQVELS